MTKQERAAARLRKLHEAKEVAWRAVKQTWAAYMRASKRREKADDAFHTALRRADFDTMLAADLPEAKKVAKL